MVFEVLDRPNKGAEQFKCTAAPRRRLLLGNAAPESLRQYKKSWELMDLTVCENPLEQILKKKKVWPWDSGEFKLAEIYSSSRSSASTFFFSFCSFLTPLKFLFCSFADEWSDWLNGWTQRKCPAFLWITNTISFVTACQSRNKCRCSFFERRGQRGEATTVETPGGETERLTKSETRSRATH